MSRPQVAEKIFMTMMQGREAGVGEHHADDLLDELSQLRAADAQLREEIVEVRRQRDEAISQAQWLILRVSNAEKAIEVLHAELSEARGASETPVEPVPVVSVAPVVEPIAVVAPLALAPALIAVAADPVDVVAEPELDEAVEVDEAQPDDVQPDDAQSDDAQSVEAQSDDADDPEVEVPSQPTPVEAVTPLAIVPGSWAGRSGPWLPPDEDAEDGSTAHEFAALTERAIAVEVAEAEEAAAAVPQVVPMNVLPDIVAETKKASLFRRR